MPGETALLGAGINAGTKHDLNIGAVIIVAAGAAIVGRTIGYGMGRELGYRLVLQYGNYVGLIDGKIKLAQYLFLRHGGKIILWPNSCQCCDLYFAGANVMPLRNFLFANAISSSVWATSYGFAAYWAGREFEHSHRHVVFFLEIIAVIVIIGSLTQFERPLGIARSASAINCASRRWTKIPAAKSAGCSVMTITVVPHCDRRNGFLVKLHGVKGECPPFGSKADIAVPSCDVRFTPESGHWNSAERCPLCATSRHSALQYRTPLFDRDRRWLGHA